MFHYKENNLVTDEDKNIIKNAFIKYSTHNEKLILNKTDFKVAWLYLFGYKPSKYEARDIFAKHNKEYYNEGLTYKEFEENAISHIKKLDVMEECRSAFMNMDFSCKGFLTIDDFQKAFNLVTPNISSKVINDVFKELDRDCDNRVSFKDFEFAIQYYDDTNNTQ